MFEMFLKKNTLSSKNNAFFLQKKSPVFLLSFIIANGHLKFQMLQFNINIINTVNKKKQYQHSGSYLPWYGVSMPYLWAGLSVLSQFLKKNVSLDCINHFGERRSVSLTFFTLGVVPLIDQSIDWLRNCMLIEGCWLVTEWLGNWTSANGMACLIRNVEEGPYIIVTEFPIKHLH